MITAIIIHGIIMPYENALSIRAIFPGPITRLTFDRNSLPQFGHELGKSKGHGRSNISIYFAQRRVVAPAGQAPNSTMGAVAGCHARLDRLGVELLRERGCQIPSSGRSSGNPLDRSPIRQLPVTSCGGVKRYRHTALAVDAPSREATGGHRHAATGFRFGCRREALPWQIPAL
jgi:hypothetical protein